MWVYLFKGSRKAATATATATTATTNGFILQGADWFLDETLGTSYEVLNQGLMDDIVVMECKQKPTNWVGSLFLERADVPYHIEKQTGDGILVNHGLWNRLLWKGARPLTYDEIKGF